jgi:hypothetical protein
LKPATTTVAVAAAAFLAACGGAGDRAARHEPVPPSSGTVLAQAEAQATSTPRSKPRAAHHRRATVRPAAGNSRGTKARKPAAARPVRTLLRALTAKPHAHSRPAAQGQSLLARVLKQHHAATPRPIAPAKPAPGQGLLSSVTNQLHNKK